MEQTTFNLDQSHSYSSIRQRRFRLDIDVRDPDSVLSPLHLKPEIFVASSAVQSQLPAVNRVKTLRDLGIQKVPMVNTCYVATCPLEV